MVKGHKKEYFDLMYTKIGVQIGALFGKVSQTFFYRIFRVATMYYMYYRGKANVLYGTILEKWVQNVLYWYYIFFSEVWKSI